MDMKSATVHSNDFGTVYTFRIKHGRPKFGSKTRNDNDMITEIKYLPIKSTGTGLESIYTSLDTKESTLILKCLKLKNKESVIVKPPLV